MMQNLKQIIVKKRPGLAYHIFAVKEMACETGLRQRPINVLISPAHYFLDDSLHGSEYIWIASILKGIISQGGFYLHIITGAVKSFKVERGSCEIYEIVPSTKPEQGIAQRLLFTIKKTVKSKLLTRRCDFRIIHHMLPFWVGVTFDLDFVLKSRKRKYILGPMQSPHSDAEADSLANSLDRFLYKVFIKVSSYLSSRTIRNADKIVAINTNTKELLIGRGVDSNRIEIITPGIDTGKFQYVPFESKDSEHIVLLAVGYLVERKGMELVIKAIGEVARNHDNFELRIIGDGPEIQNLKDLTKNLGLEKVVRFYGPIPHAEINKQYEEAHVFVSMSRAESWGQVYLEAMASGLPVVTTENVGSREIVKDGVFGYLVRQEDYTMLAERVIHLMNNKLLLADFGRKAREEAEETYDWEKVIVPKYINLYESLIV